MVPTPYQERVNASSLTGPDSLFEADPNNDKVQNGIAFLLGAPDGNSDATALLPGYHYDSASTGFTFSYRRANDVNDDLEFSQDLENWTSATETPDITRNIIPDGYGSGIDRVDYLLSGTFSQNGRLFLRPTVTP